MNEKILDRLLKLKDRTRGKRVVWPANNCTDIDTHLCGMFLREHIEVIIEALRRGE